MLKKFSLHVDVDSFLPATDEEKKKAETAANDMLKKCKNVEDLKTQAEAGKTAGTVYDQGTLTVPKGKMVSAFEDWAYGASRKEGELGIIYSQDYGYFVVGYMGKAKLDEEDQESIANDAMNAEIEKEMQENKHNFHTEQKYGAAKAAPTAVPEPTSAVEPSNQGGETAPTALPTESGVTPADNGMSNVLIIVFVAIGGVAIVAVIIILIMNSKGSDKDESSSKSKTSSSKKSSKKVVVEDDEDEDDTFIKKLFSSSSLSAIRVVSSAYLRLLIFLLAILIPACASSSPAFLMMYSAYKLNKQGDNIQP